MAAARSLIAWGIPVFLAKPARDSRGQWDPHGGHRETGYWMPRGWQNTRPDSAVLERWRPGMALCAVMGHGIDVLDVDPRNDGDSSRAELVAEGVWPTVWFTASTPSGGTHEFVSALGIHSKNDVRPGLDVKAGNDGAGHGFAFIAPTLRASKVTGRIQPYRWLRPPADAMPANDGSGAQIVQLVGNPTRTRGRSHRSGGKGDAAGSAAFAALSEDEPPCSAMLKQVDVIAKGLANGGRHDAITGPLLRLVGLAEIGHQGLRRACALVEHDYVSRVADDRAGGQAEARSEFQRSLMGALSRVLGERQGFRRDVACDCFLESVATAAGDPRLFNRGSRGVTERKVLSYLHLAARKTRSRVICESQRQIAEGAFTSRPVVARALIRLEDLNWIRRTPNRNFLAPDRIRLLVPEVRAEMPTEKIAGVATPASLADGISMHGRVHHLFGPQGLSAGSAETLAALAERTGPKLRRRSDGLRLRLLQVTPGSQPSELLMDPWQGPRQIPRPARGGGRTVQELAEITGKNRSTISRHLKQLKDRGLVFEQRTSDGKRRWWRLRFDPDQIADRDQIPDTSGPTAAKHSRERRAFLTQLSGKEGSVVKRRLIGEMTALVDSRTEEVLDIVPTEDLGIDADATDE
ncbi:hypothetical protein GCM10022399_37450 [Terrabacter ginsenosidimutans]|uniref:Uncharacterized protein n=1 Tax=Terrabacter ginsenosidimutans TaxID=490575 RepID=A0ABP7ECP9_9MICO